MPRKILNRSLPASRIFLLSPAYAGGRRAQMIMSERAEFELAKKLRSEGGATIADVFTFLSGLYFRGKIAYANAFASPAKGNCGVFVITPTRGLVDVRSTMTLSDLREFAGCRNQRGEPAVPQTARTNGVSSGEGFDGRL